MALINIKHPHSLQISDARDRSEKLANEVKRQLAAFGSALAWNWENANSESNKLKLEATTGLAKGLVGNVEVLADSIVLGVDLPLMLRGMKGAIEKQIREALTLAFG